MVLLKEFIYVFNEDDRDTLQREGFMLLKADDKNSVYIFKSRPELSFDYVGVSTLVFSDILTF